MLRAEQFLSAKGAFKAGRARESVALARGSQTGRSIKQTSHRWVLSVCAPPYILIFGFNSNCDVWRFYQDPAHFGRTRGIYIASGTWPSAENDERLFNLL